MSETRYIVDRAMLEEIGKEISGAIIAGIAETVAAAIIARMSTDAQEAGTGAALDEFREEFGPYFSDWSQEGEAGE